MTKMPRTNKIRNTGSAIILAVVLTSLLAIVGIVFLLSSRVNSIATSSISENKDLNLAVDTVVAQISETLSLDVPGVDPNGEYYDYPDSNFDPWLAALEPYSDAGTPRWSQISDVYNELRSYATYLDEFGDRIEPNQVRAKTWKDATPVGGAELSGSYIDFGGPADADGDGVTDSRWVRIPEITSNKGKPIYAAIRIIDNGGMLNANTGYKFDSNTADGSSQMQINLLALASRINDVLTPLQIQFRENSLLQARANYPVSGLDPNNLALYEQDVIWRYANPANAYTPFDISDELESRYRFLLNQEDVDTRLEDWGSEWRDSTISTPVPSGGIELDKWFRRAGSYGDPGPDPNYTYDYYAYRHIATIQNFDRIIDPKGDKMLNINKAYGPNDTNEIDALQNTIREALIAGGFASAFADSRGTQLTANLVDYVDGPGYLPSDPAYDPNDDVTTVYDDAGIPHFGFEQPAIYISELAQNFFQADANDPNTLERSYAIELYKPYFEDLAPLCPNGVGCDWQLVISDPCFGVTSFGVNWSGTRQFHVLLNDEFLVIDVNLAEFEANSPSPLDGAIGVDVNVILSWPAKPAATSYDVYLGTNQAAVTYATPADANIFMDDVPDTQTTFDPPGLLVMNTTYYWRIDHGTATGLVKGPVWRFTVSDADVQNVPIVFTKSSLIELQRRIYDPDPCSPGWIYVTVDSVDVAIADINNLFWLRPTTGDPNDPNVRRRTHSFQRDISPHKPIRRLWDIALGRIDFPSVGYHDILNDYVDPDSRVIQAHPENEIFTSIGDFGRLFYNTTYEYGGLGPFAGITEPQLRIDLGLPGYQQLFQYLTVFDPTVDGIDNDGDGAAEPDIDELKIKGRININTAPWFVIAQLPWVSEKIGVLNYDLARNIVAYRDKAPGPAGNYFTIRPGQLGFQNIAQLNLVVDPNVPLASIDYYWRDINDLQTYPDLTFADNAVSDFEERDVIFARLSNLVTVRSDVFTAYILVRIGKDGPQKRVAAILDRSNVYPDSTAAGGYRGRVKILAIHPVPDPR